MHMIQIGFKLKSTQTYLYYYATLITSKDIPVSCLNFYCYTLDRQKFFSILSRLFLNFKIFLRILFNFRFLFFAINPGNARD